MSKALIFTDLHLHSHKGSADRLQDCVKVLDWVFQTAAEKGCKYIFFLGDLFHERAKIDVLNYLRTFEVFMKHMIGDATNREVYLLVGNHDMYHKERWDINSIRPLSAIPGVHIVQEPTSMQLGGRQIDWLPHTENPIKELAIFKKKVGDLLLAHLAVHGAYTNTFYGVRSDVIVEYDNDMVPVDPTIFDDWPMTLLGHYHGWQRISKTAEYIGSPLQLSYGESFQQKHVIVLDLETMEKEYILNDFSPKHLIVTTEDIENEAYDFTGQFVRISVNDTGRADLVDIQRKLIKEWKPICVDIKQNDEKTAQADAELVMDAKAVLDDIESMLKRYMKDRGVPDGLLEDHLLEAGVQCLVQKTSS